MEPTRAIISVYITSSNADAVRNAWILFFRNQKHCLWSNEFERIVFRICTFLKSALPMSARLLTRFMPTIALNTFRIKITALVRFISWSRKMDGKLFRRERQLRRQRTNLSKFGCQSPEKSQIMAIPFRSISAISVCWNARGFDLVRTVFCAHKFFILRPFFCQCRLFFIRRFFFLSKSVSGHRGYAIFYERLEHNLFIQHSIQTLDIFGVDSLSSLRLLRHPFDDDFHGRSKWK